MFLNSPHHKNWHKRLQCRSSRHFLYSPSIDNTLFGTCTKCPIHKYRPDSDSLTLTCILYTSTVHMHTSHASHIFTIYYMYCTCILSHSTISLGNSRNHLSSLTLCFTLFSRRLKELFFSSVGLVNSLLEHKWKQNRHKHCIYVLVKHYVRQINQDLFI